LSLLVAGVIVVNFWPAKEESAIAFGEWDWVLITDFENRTTEPVLDGTVEYALQRELSNSSFVKVVSQERINDALSLMKLPHDSVIDIATGREISLRDGGINMLLTGRVDKLGNSYLLSTDLVNPTDGVTLASFSVDATGQDQILDKIRVLSKEVRTALGEGLQLIEATDKMLEKVTTPSLQALQLFSEADRLMSGPERSRAMTVLEEAVRLDPDFASAHLLLSYLHGDRENDERQSHYLERAVALADHASERERLFILATYYAYLQDKEKSVEIYELMVSRYPDHYWANGNLSNIYEQEGRIEEAKQLRMRVSEARPNSIDWYPDLDVLQFAVATGDTEIRDVYFQRLETVADQADYGWIPPMLAMLPVHEAWVSGNYDAALAELDQLVSERGRDALLADGFLYAQIRSVYLALGTLEHFREITALRPQLGWFEAILDYDSGRLETLGRYLETTEIEEWNAVLMAFSGRFESARLFAADPDNYQFVQPKFSAKAWRNLAHGQSALAEGNLQEAISLLDRDVNFLCITSKWAYFFAKHSLASAYERQGDLQSAIATLEQVAAQKPLSIFEMGGAYLWQRNRYYLQRLYQANGEAVAAQRVQQELREMLRLADPGHPFLDFDR
jgi:tetratricopeptide (TPR) repeat protein